MRRTPRAASAPASIPVTVRGRWASVPASSGGGGGGGGMADGSSSRRGEASVLGVVGAVDQMPAAGGEWILEGTGAPPVSRSSEAPRRRAGWSMIGGGLERPEA